MKAVLHTAEPLAWAEPLGLPWPLLPVGNRPWVEYWIEWCVERGIRDIRVVLGDGAYEIEQYLGDGARWGVQLSYGFLRNTADPDAYLRRNPASWRGGLFYLRRPCFPRRRNIPNPGTTPAAFSPIAAWHGEELLCVGTPDDAALDAVTSFRRIAGTAAEPADVEAQPIVSLHDYYALNMALVRGEIAHYLTPGYARQENAYLGFNVVYPQSAELHPPLIVGNDCRIHALANVGPASVLGSRTIVDRQAVVRHSVVLDGTYVGAGVEIDGRIVAGRRLIDPEDGTVLELDDLHLLAALDRDASQTSWVRDLTHRALALLLILTGFIPWLVGLLAGHGAGANYRRERFAGRNGKIAELPVWQTHESTQGLLHRLGLDVWPWLRHVVAGRLWLVGQLPCRMSEAAETQS